VREEVSSRPVVVETTSRHPHSGASAMSTIDRERSVTIPPLVDGQRLDRATFHERYEAMPPETRAELIDGVVVMSSPAGVGHGTFWVTVTGWLFHFFRGVPGLQAAADATVLLDDRAEPQPDLQLFIAPELGGQIRLEHGYVAGAPELVIEIAKSSKKTDLGPKLKDYERTGVVEYVVVALDPDAVHWFVRRGDRFESMPPGPDGVFRSQVFPGLWLDPGALFSADLNRLVATLDRGRATPAHAAFVASLAARAKPEPFTAPSSETP
jgi:Uma2 family endonuclease